MYFSHNTDQAGKSGVSCELVKGRYAPGTNSYSFCQVELFVSPMTSVASGLFSTAPYPMFAPCRYWLLAK